MSCDDMLPINTGVHTGMFSYRPATPPPPASEKIGAEEAACFLECSEEQLRKMLAAGDLPGLKSGKAWVIPRVAFYAACNRLAEKAAEARRAELTSMAERKRFAELAERTNARAAGRTRTPLSPF